MKSKGNIKTMIRPRPYLSYRQLTLIEAGPEQYARVYLEGYNFKANANLKLGKVMADSLENEEDTGDVLIDLVVSKLPKFEIMDKEFIVNLPSGIPILIKPDTYKKTFDAFKEYKTGIREYEWNQKEADKSDQITFYAVGMYLKVGKVCQDIELCYAPTEYTDQGELVPTGEVIRIPTKRDIKQIMKMMARMEKAWKAIGKLMEDQLL